MFFKMNFVGGNLTLYIVNIARFLTVFLIFAGAVSGDEPLAKQFLRYIYGADGIVITNVCHASPDLWMLRGANETNKLAKIDGISVETKTNGLVSGVLDLDIYLVETRDGKVDPSFNLDQVYQKHRQLVVRFIIYALMGDNHMLGRLVTDPAKVVTLGPKPPRGEFEQYASILALTPAVRSSRPEDDSKAGTISYRVPLGQTVVPLTLVKQGSTWKIDTSQSVQLSFDFLFH